MKPPDRGLRLFSVCSLLRSVLAGAFWMVSLPGVSQTKAILTVDLVAKGLPADAFGRSSYKNCPYQYFTYRSVEWLDPQLLMVAFSTSPSCAKNPGILAGNLRLITFDLKGNSLHSTDIAYDAGDGIGIRVIENGGVWIGPSQSVIVEVPGSHLKAQPNSRDKVLVFSSELTPEQEIGTDSHENYYDALRFGGVTADRQSVLFWTSDGVVMHERQCLLFRGRPLKQVSSCKSQDVDDLALPTQYRQSDLFPKGYSIRAFAGSSVDAGRITLFGVKEGGLLGGCDFFGKLCPSHGILITFETATNRPLFRRILPLDGRAALSPSGAHLAVLENNRLELFPLP